MVGVVSVGGARVATSDADAAVVVAGLSHAYGGGPRVLDGVSLSVGWGERLALIGPNGSGKSTLLSVLSTRLKPVSLDGESAELRVAGFDPRTEAAAVRRAISVVFQSPSVDGKLTAEENLKYEAMLHGLRGTDRGERIEEALASAGLLDRRKDRVETFSGGMKRRLEIGKAMMHRPSVLMLDEPDAGLDVGALDTVWEQLEAARAARRTTLVMATHRMELAERCDAVAVLRDGVCLACESPAALRDRLPGGVLRVEAVAADLDAVREALVGLKGGWSAGSEPRVQRGEVVAYDDRPGELARGLESACGERVVRVSYGRSSMRDVFMAMTGEALVD